MTKKRLTSSVAFALVCTANLSFAQSSLRKEAINNEGQTVITLEPSSFAITKPVIEWETIEDNIPFDARKKVRNEFTREGYLDAQNTVEVDPVLQSIEGDRVNRSPLISFNGQSGSGYPPDPSGAADANYYVQAVNSAYRIYNKNGTPKAGPFSLSTMWPGQGNLGDPIVMYDRHAGRWFVSQFGQNPNKVLLAVSQTGDPTGAYYTYSFNLSQFPDYPKYSIWWDGYYMTSNSQHTAVVFEREKMIAGDPTARMVSLSLPSLGNGGFRSPLPADADGPLPPNGTPCYFFNLEDNAFNGVSQDQVEIYEMVTDWTNTANTSVQSSQQLALPSFDAVFTGGFANVSQPGTNQKLDVIQGVLMYRAQHMRWTGYNTIMLSHAVDLGSNRSGVRWYELRDANNGVWSVYQSGTYAPTNTASRWMSSVAMDNFGNIGMAYVISDPTNTIYPGIRYTGRLATDALGDMSFLEQVGVLGTASQSGIDRFGDYAHLALDPDGSTFWYTSEYIGGTGTNGSPRTRIMSFSILGEAGVNENPFYAELDMKVFQKDGMLTVNTSGIHGEEAVELGLVNMSGQDVFISSALNPNNGTLTHSFSVNSLAKGTYFVRLGNQKFQKVSKVVIQ